MYVNSKNGILAQGSMLMEIRIFPTHDLIYNVNPTLSTLRISNAPIQSPTMQSIYFYKSISFM